jgi:hypothetical protein
MTKIRELLARPQGRCLMLTSNGTVRRGKNGQTVNGLDFDDALDR